MLEAAEHAAVTCVPPADARPALPPRLGPGPRVQTPTSAARRCTGPSDATLSTSVVSVTSHEDSGPHALEAPWPRLLLPSLLQGTTHPGVGPGAAPAALLKPTSPDPWLRTKAMILTHSDTCREQTGAGHAGTQRCHTVTPHCVHAPPEAKGLRGQRLVSGGSGSPAGRAHSVTGSEAGRRLWRPAWPLSGSHRLCPNPGA